MHVLGIDIGGSGMKAAPVDLTTGTLLSDRHRIPTPQPPRPDSMTEVVGQLTQHFDWDGPVGVCFPARIKKGVARTAANISDDWIGVNLEERFSTASGCPVTVLNDADAAGVAEMEYGAGQGRRDLVLMLTFGTGIGSALFWDEELIPNTELGHLRFTDDRTAEEFASDRIREAEDLAWDVWGQRVRRVLQYLDFLLTPDLIIIGGGVSRPHRYERFAPELTDLDTEIVPAELENEAGIIGAAYAAVHSAMAGKGR
ncbi:MAG: ROK family protein [Bacteroidetes bacterium]|jgi:polyphosphate glucokinase|nr:ROK family protein [Bacteroidota bacterium]